MSNQSLT